MLCRLCLLDCDNLLEIFDNEGSRLKISSIVAQHFGFQLYNDDQISNKICTTCWFEVENFHAFYVDVRRAQDRLKIELAKNVDPDPDTDEDDCNDSEFCSSDDYEDCCESDPSFSREFAKDCDQDDSSAIWEDTSNVTGDIDVFAAPSRTGSRNLLKRKIRSRYYPAKNKIIVADIDSSKFKIDGQGISSFDPMKGITCTRKSNAEDIIRKNFKKLGIAGLSKIIDRNELSITAVPRKNDNDDDTITKENEEEISKYVQLNCELCGEKFNIFSELKYHFRTDHNITGYVVCCNEKLFKPVHLVNHVMKHLDRSRFIQDSGNSEVVDSGVEARKCPFCHESFDEIQQLNHHLQEHYTPKSMRAECQQCGLWCKSRFILQKHIRTHITGSEDHICTICGKKFLSDIALHRHLTNVHYKERKFQCSMCNKAFKWSINLKEHMAIHTGQRLYSCPYCSKKFNASSNMHSHRKKAHREEWEEERKKRLEMAINE